DRLLKFAKQCINPMLLGNCTPSGRIIRERKGHFNDKYKPSDDYNTKQIFVSSSIRYASQPAYADTQRWYDTTSKTWYDARIAFQVWIRPGSFTLTRETIGARNQIDPYVKNKELEWATSDKSAVILRGLLVNLT
ncbi:neuralized-like protein 4, partial [Saccoglossus kowalevskii]